MKIIKTIMTILALATISTSSMAFEINTTSKGLMVTLSNVEIFHPQTPSLTKDGMLILSKIINKIPSDINSSIIVEAHTDIKSIKDTDKFRYPSNWELGSFKAASVLRYIKSIKEDNLDSIHIESFAGSKPKYPNFTKDGRLKNNRIIINVVYESRQKRNVFEKKVEEVKSMKGDSIFKEYMYTTAGSCSDVEKEYIHTLLFADREIELQPSQKQVIENIETYIRHRGRIISIIIESHSSSSEDILKNNIYSIERSENIRNFLKTNIKSNIIKMIPYGSSYSLSQKNLFSNKDINNRVKVSVIRCLDKYKPIF